MKENHVASAVDPTVPHEGARSGRPSLILAGLLVASLALAGAAPTPIHIVGAAVVLIVNIASAISSLERVGPTATLLTASILVLALANGGLAESADGSVALPLLCLAAYPLLGRGLLLHVSRYRLLRRSDLVVEAVLIGAAAAIVLQASADWRAIPTGASDALTRSGAPTLLVGLDVALMIVVAWSLRIPTARRGAIGIVAAGLSILTASHIVNVLQLAAGNPPGPAAESLLALALLLIGGAVVHTLLVSTDHVTAVEPPLFSRGHASIVVIALMAAPTTLLVQTVRGVSVSTTVATGTALSGVVLANYVIELLRERADSEREATHDPLTLLPNRVLFMDRLERALAHASRNNAPVGLLYLDLDHFKDVNDTLGHDAGDHLLRVTAERLLQCARHEDTVARLGGDEFAILLPHLRSDDDAALVAGRMLEALSQPTTVGGHELRNPASIGVATFPIDGSDPNALMSAADEAMYRAKEHAGSAVELCGDRSNAHAELLATETALYEAIQRDELVLHYQPVVDASTHKILGAEALVRWEHPEKGLLQPGQFIPVAERSDLIVLLGEWVLKAAFAEQARWSKVGFGDRFVSVNVSARQFGDELVSMITAALRSSGANGKRIVLEVTETAAVDDVEVVARSLRELRALGVTAAIDDFGTGYCSLQYLGDLPVSTLKIDKSFVQAMTPRSAAIVAATIAMGQSLGMTIVAEGVETAAQARFLLHHGCDRLQGYHLAKPMPADDLVELMQAQARALAPKELQPTAGAIGGPSDQLAEASRVPRSRGLRHHRLVIPAGHGS